jgi:hypothetical protein
VAADLIDRVKGELNFYQKVIRLYSFVNGHKLVCYNHILIYGGKDFINPLYEGNGTFIYLLIIGENDEVLSIIVISEVLLLAKVM